LPAQQDVKTKGDKALAESRKHKHYEAVFIIRPNLDEDAVDRTVATVEEFVKAQGGIIEQIDKKGRKRLAYEVDKMRDGYYVVMNYKGKPESVAPLKRMMTLSEDVMRSLVVVLEPGMVGKS